MEIYTDILCTNCVQKITNNIMFIEVIFSGDLRYVVEAGTGLANYCYKRLFMFIFIESMVPV